MRWDFEEYAFLADSVGEHALDYLGGTVGPGPGFPSGGCAYFSAPDGGILTADGVSCGGDGDWTWLGWANVAQNDSDSGVYGSGMQLIAQYTMYTDASLQAFLVAKFGLEVA